MEEFNRAAEEGKLVAWGQCVNGAFIDGGLQYADLSDDVRKGTWKVRALFAQFFAYYRGGTELYELEGEAVVEEED